MLLSSGTKQIDLSYFALVVILSCVNIDVQALTVLHQLGRTASSLEPFPDNECRVTKSLSEREVSGPDMLSGTLLECVLIDFQNEQGIIHN